MGLWGTLKEQGQQTIRNSGWTTIKKHTSVEDVRKVGDWARTFTWNVFFKSNDFVQVPRQFCEWMPATDISFDLAGIESQDFAAGNFNISIPKNAPAYKMSISFLDDRRLLIMNWLNMWLYGTVNTEQGTTLPFKDASCECGIALTDSLGDKTYFGAYYVYPSYTQQVQRNSSSEVVNYSVEFNVTGVVEDLIYRNWDYESMFDNMARLWPFHKTVGGL